MAYLIMKTSKKQIGKLLVDYISLSASLSDFVDILNIDEDVIIEVLNEYENYYNSFECDEEGLSYSDLQLIENKENELATILYILNAERIEKTEYYNLDLDIFLDCENVADQQSVKFENYVISWQKSECICNADFVMVSNDDDIYFVKVN